MQWYLQIAWRKLTDKKDLVLQGILTIVLCPYSPISLLNIPDLLIILDQL